MLRIAFAAALLLKAVCYQYVVLLFMFLRLACCFEGWQAA
jgi:hypothetical protein